MSLYSELDSLGLDELITKFQGTDPEEKVYDSEHGVYFEELAYQILKQGEDGYQFLIKTISTTDFVRQRSILAALSTAKQHQPEVQQLLYVFLDDHRPLIVSEAIRGLESLEDINFYDKVLSKLTHSSPYVRSAVLNYVARIDGKSSKQILIAALADEHFVVRETAVDALGELEIIEAYPYLKPLLNDPHPDVQQATETAIDSLNEVAR